MKNTICFIVFFIIWGAFFFLQRLNPSQNKKAKAEKKLSNKQLHWKNAERDSKIFKKISKDTVGKVPIANYEYAIAARIKASGESWVETSFYEYRFEEKKIEKQDLSSLFEILNDSSSYGAPQAMCFNPQISVVLYDSLKQPVEAYLICLDCNHIESKPKVKAYDSGFTKKARKKLREILNDKWNLHYYDCSEMLDGKECEVLDKKRIKDSVRIKNEMKKYQEFQLSY